MNPFSKGNGLNDDNNWKRKIKKLIYVSKVEARRSALCEI